MRRDLYGGLSVAAAGLLLVLVGGWLDLELSALALLGVAAGAVVALVPDRTAALRIAGFAAGFVIAWLGYFFRAALMPDTDPGRAVYVGVVLALAAVVSMVAVGRLPLWAVLVGVGTFAGAFEKVYEAAPPLVLDNSISTATTLLLAVAVGFMAVAWVAPPEHETQTRTRDSSVPERELDARGTPRKNDDTVALDSMMDTKR